MWNLHSTQHHKAKKKKGSLVACCASFNSKNKGVDQKCQKDSFTDITQQKWTVLTILLIARLLRPTYLIRLHTRRLCESSQQPPEQQGVAVHPHVTGAKRGEGTCPGSLSYYTEHQARGPHQTPSATPHIPSETCHVVGAPGGAAWCGRELWTRS